MITKIEPQDPVISQAQVPGDMLYISAGPDSGYDAGFGRNQLLFKDLTAESLQPFNPSAVVCQLFTEQLDAIMVLRRLSEIGYKGRCIVISPKLPRSELVMNELRAEADGIAIELIELTQPH